MDIQRLLRELTVEEKAALVAGVDFMYTNPCRGFQYLPFACLTVRTDFACSRRVGITALRVANLRRAFPRRLQRLRAGIPKILIKWALQSGKNVRITA